MLRYLLLGIAVCWQICVQAQVFPPSDVTASFNPAPVSPLYITAVCEDTVGNRLFTARYGSPGPNHWDLRKTNINSGTTASIASYSTSSSGIPIPTRKIIYNNNKLY
ncbi:MAG: hypothetical protein ACRC3B_23975, partial [Bacteroidia bacterium]